MSNHEPYTLEYSSDARDALRKLDREIARQIGRKLRWLADHADELAHGALKGRWSGAYRLRVGDYRAIYKLDHGARLVLVTEIGHRRNVYDE